jgi:DtxR family Mn-dependent transcriptional regulator
VISDRVAEKLEGFLGNPTTSPYGNPIPGSEEGRADDRLEPLAALPPGRVRIVRISEQLQGDPEVMHALGNARVYAGMEVDVALTGAGFELRHAGGTVTVDGDAAQLLYVVPVPA